MKLGLELGGNAPFIVFDDADLDAAVEGAMVSKYRNNGQTCVCANRLYVQAGVYDAFAEKLAARVSAMKVGDGFEDGVVAGPLITEKAVQKVEEHIADALAKGGAIAVGGKRDARGGLFFEPTILTGVTSAMQVVDTAIILGLYSVYVFSIPSIMLFSPPKTAASSVMEVEIAAKGSLKCLLR